MQRTIRFSETTEVEPRPGIYEIRTLDGVLLKIGIAGNLRRRLRHHGRSSQSGLKFQSADSAAHPNEVASKRSILAKHLYFDESIARDCDLRTEIGRQKFLEERCRVTIEFTATRAAARELEILRERTGEYRYCGVVIIR